MARYKEDMICDLAEVYHIYDYRRVPGRLLGTLVAGLGVNSRVYQKLAGQLVPTDILMQSLIVDELRRITYLLNGDKNKTYPKPITESFLQDAKPDTGEMAFNTPEEFERTRAALLGEINGRAGSR